MVSIYNLYEYREKLPLLIEYYKFHNEIPRMFMMPISEMLNKFHDKKRRIEYYRVKKMLFD